MIKFDKKIIVKNINFSLKKGEYLVLTGPNGSGKSSILKAILGLIPKNIKGSISFNIDKKDISYLSQNNKIPLFFNASVKEIIMSGNQIPYKNMFFYNKNDYEKYKEIVKLLEIENIVDIPFKKISKGQQQKALLARAFCKIPKLIFLDEPCSFLDEKSINKVYKIINIFNKKKLMTVFIISHDLENIKKYNNNIKEIKLK